MNLIVSIGDGAGGFFGHIVPTASNTRLPALSRIVHRDIKPENIVLSNKHALVTDFGIARHSATGVASVTLTGSRSARPRTCRRSKRPETATWMRAPTSTRPGW